jgi:hypothetical protein
MLEKIYELKAQYEAEMAHLAVKLEVLNDLLALVPTAEEEVVEEELVEAEVEQPDELEGL